MIEDTEIAQHAATFGVPDNQIVRDHLISHALHALGTVAATVGVTPANTAPAD